MFKKLVQMGIQKVTGRGKVSPTIKSVKPNLKKTVQETKQDLEIKNLKKVLY